MPIPTYVLDPMLGTFRTMMQEVVAKGLTGPAVDEMRTQLAAMEQAGQEMSDIAAFSGRLVQEGRFDRFGQAYGQALASGAAAPAGDSSLLSDAIAAYENALARHRELAPLAATNPAAVMSARLVPALEQIVAIGKASSSYPAFLRALVERDLDRVGDDDAPTTRAGLEVELAHAQRSWDRWRIEHASRMLAWLDGAGATARDIDRNLVSTSLDRELLAPARLWALRVSAWEKIISGLVDWLDAHADFAVQDERWRGPTSTDADVKRNIARTKACQPGEIVLRVAWLSERLGVAWDRLIEHETFAWQYSARQIAWTDERLRLVFATRPHCVPGGAPPRELVAQTEELRRTGRTWRRPEQRGFPAWGTPLSTLSWSR